MTSVEKAGCGPDSHVLHRLEVVAGRPPSRTATVLDMERRSINERHRRRATLRAVAERQHGVVGVRQAYRSGLSEAEILAEIDGRRWRRAGHQSLVLHTGPLHQQAREWLAVLDAGPRACLDGASSLVCAGLANFTVERIRVSVPRGVPVHSESWVDVRQTRRWRADDLADDVIPRTRNEVATVRAGLWARTEREAGLIVAMAVQQRLTTPGLLAAEMLKVRRDKRRMLVNELVIEVGGGAESLGEVDFARECRARGFPEPSRQSVRRSPTGRYFLDVEWRAYGVVLEIDGIQHSWAQNAVDEALRQNSLSISGALVLHLPLAGLRWAPDDFFAQIDVALRSRGWAGVRHRL